jgi:hypothetical protein
MLYNFCFKVVLERNLHLKMLELCGPALIGLKPSKSNRYPMVRNEINKLILKN